VLGSRLLGQFKQSLTFPFFCGKTKLPKILLLPKIPFCRQCQFVEYLLAQKCISIASERTDSGQGASEIHGLN
jgi:hypothetical protein